MPRWQDEATRFWTKVDKTDDCWLWVGARSVVGYGLFVRTGSGKNSMAHRWSYEQAQGAIPPGLELDHVCRVKPCVRPDHLEAVTHQENMRRAIWKKNIHCKYGHEITGEGDRRQCMTCHSDRQRERKAKRRAEQETAKPLS